MSPTHTHFRQWVSGWERIMERERERVCVWARGCVEPGIRCCYPGECVGDVGIKATRKDKDFQGQVGWGLFSVLAKNRAWWRGEGQPADLSSAISAMFNDWRGRWNKNVDIIDYTALTAHTHSPITPGRRQRTEGTRIISWKYSPI